jgi:quercetin dioxygenase-like cupin family protein
MIRTIKTWGEKLNIFQNDLCEVSLLYLKTYRRCSWHKHQTKFNLFHVVEGEIFIKTEEGKIKVSKGQVFTTSPGEIHEFQTHDKEATVIEIMYVKYSESDIQRFKIGGYMDNTD